MTVKNWLTSLQEKVVYFAPDGKRYNLHDPSGRAVLSMNGWGMPQVDYAETRGPFQHGTTPLTVRLGAREIEVNIAYARCSRDEYWASRAALMDALRVSRTDVNNPSPGYLRWYRSDGTIRQVDVLIKSGPEFPAGKGWNSFGFEDTLVFKAFDPIIYDPTQGSDYESGFGCTPEERLVFPFSFDYGHLAFGGSYCDVTKTATINYTGTWQSYPTIVLTGAMTDAIILHNQTGKKIEFKDYTLPSGRVVTIDLAYNSKTVTLDDGSSLLAYISDDSALGDFAILPDPLVAGGVNTISIIAANADTNADATISWYVNYKGI